MALGFVGLFVRIFSACSHGLGVKIPPVMYLAVSDLFFRLVTQRLVFTVNPNCEISGPHPESETEPQTPPRPSMNRSLN